MSPRPERRRARRGRCRMPGSRPPQARSPPSPPHFLAAATSRTMMIAAGSGTTSGAASSGEGLLRVQRGGGKGPKFEKRWRVAQNLAGIGPSHSARRRTNIGASISTKRVNTSSWDWSGPGQSRSVLHPLFLFGVSLALRGCSFLRTSTLHTSSKILPGHKNSRNVHESGKSAESTGLQCHIAPPAPPPSPSRHWNSSIWSALGLNAPLRFQNIAETLDPCWVAARPLSKLRPLCRPQRAFRHQRASGGLDGCQEASDRARHAQLRVSGRPKLQG